MLLRDITDDMEDLQREIMRECQNQARVMQTDNQNMYRQQYNTNKRLGFHEMIQNAKDLMKHIKGINRSMVEGSAQMSNMLQKEKDKCEYLERQIKYSMDKDP